VQVRATNEFSGVDDLLALPHGVSARIRVSMTAATAARRFEGGTDAAAARVALAVLDLT